MNIYLKYYEYNIWLIINILQAKDSYIVLISGVVV
jgi:hypothetical protein